jgi:hypothetical protein
VKAALPSYEKPRLLDDEEVEAFCQSLGGEPEEFHEGDVIRVLDGYLSGLYGIVVEVVDGGSCVAVFRFYVKTLKERLGPGCFEVVGNVRGSLQRADPASNVVDGG